MTIGMTMAHSIQDRMAVHSDPPGIEVIALCTPRFNEHQPDQARFMLRSPRERTVPVGSGGCQQEPPQAREPSAR
jgi:hypothetical protein